MNVLLAHCVHEIESGWCFVHYTLPDMGLGCFWVWTPVSQSLKTETLFPTYGLYMHVVLIGGHDPFWESDDAPPAGVVGTGENGEVKKFKRQTRMNWSGCSVMLCYFGILCFYLYIRVSKTLDLGQYFWYGIIVLIVEIMGASTTLLYGVNLLLHPVYQPVPKDESGKPMVTLAYHVRVLVPCYKESLEILARTCSAALEAVLPEGCTQSVYLCDDGGDATKRKWVQSKAAEKGCNIYYVSGRKRSPGEMNGKSANLNNCLKMLYPGDRAVPPNELVCIFDADQVANKDFYTKTLPLFDAGDDVGMVLSPQAFYNLNQRADIFNHSNIHFWEYAQHGYDAIGFISCTGEPIFFSNAHCPTLMKLVSRTDCLYS